MIVTTAFAGSGERPFVVVDTGGLSGVEDAMDVLTAKQVRLAIAEADVLVFVVDARDGLLPQDYVILNELRRSGKTIIAAVNKTDGLEDGSRLAEFSCFGVGNILPLSAAHNRGTDELIGMILPLLPATRRRKRGGRRGWKHSGCHRRAAECWQVDLDQPAAWGGSADCLGCRGYHA